MSRLTFLFSLTSQYIQKRSISLSAPRESKRNFRKFLLYNKRGHRIFKENRTKNTDPDLAIDKRGCKDVGYSLNGRFVLVPEMIPELIVPDLKDCTLKPYVSYKAPDIVQTKFTAEQLFAVVYAEKIKKDFKDNKLDADGNSLDPSDEEKMTPEEASIKAKQTGSDIFEKKREEWVAVNEAKALEETMKFWPKK